MPLSDAQEKALVVRELGKTGDAEFASLVDSLWTRYDYAPAIHPRLRAYLAKRDAILSLIAQNADAVSYKEADVSEDLSQYLANLEKLLGLINAQIDAVSASRGPRTGLITRVAPITTQDALETPVEPNDRGYRGDALVRAGRTFVP